jgi:acetylornithine deacetylase
MFERKLTTNGRRLQQLLRKMVNIYSPPGKENDLVDFLYSYLKRHGLPVVRQTVDEDRHNLIVEPDDVEAELVLLGHLDTVEAYDLESYEFSLEGDTASGLGTADMKGGCAAMIEAFLTLWENGHTNRPVALALVVGEEDYGDGAQRLVREYDFSAAIVGEPTDLLPCLSHYGYLEIQLTTQGTAGPCQPGPPGQQRRHRHAASAAGLYRLFRPGVGERGLQPAGPDQRPIRLCRA